MEKRFRALRFIGTLYKVLAWISLVGSVLVALFMVLSGAGAGLAGSDQASKALGGAFAGALGGIVVGMGVLIGGLIYFLILYAVAEAIYVILSIEENTRLTAMALSGRVSG